MYSNTMAWLLIESRPSGLPSVVFMDSVRRCLQLKLSVSKTRNVFKGWDTLFIDSLGYRRIKKQLKNFVLNVFV